MDYRSTIDQRYSSDVSNRERDVPSFIEPRPPLILNPFMRPRPQKGTNLLELFEEDDSVEDEAPELVQVYLRLKPSNVPSSLYEVRSDQHLITSVDTATAGHGRRTQHNVSKMYTFSHIFGPDASQKEIFEHVVKDNLRKLPDGHNFTLLTYGASGSGKTYTLMGTVKAPGLVPRSLEYVFKVVDAAQTPLYQPGESKANKLSLAQQEHELQWVRHLRHVSAPLRDKYRRMSTRLCSDMTKSTIDLSNRTKHYVWVSFVEIYNEAIYDLLVTTERTSASKLRIREDPCGNVYVKGATQAFVRTGEEAYDVMVAGKHNLQVHATGVHAHSSRSHCIFTITMLTETEGGVRSSYVRLCDLAGSERARRTRNTGARMAESRAINSSLHVLERCLHTLRRKRAHDLVPYRESKLTRLLGAGLSGTRGEAVSMVVTLNPAPEYAHETRHVLQLAAVARDIQVNNTIAESISTLESSSHDTTVCSSSELVRLRADNERLHYELVQAQALNKKLMADMAEQQEENAVTVKELVDEARDITQQYYQSQIRGLEARHDAEMAELREEYEAKLAVKNVVADEGTPSRALQNKVMQLMKQIALLEEELSAERLARARMNEELLHLRACIEERDEKASDDNSNQEDAIQLTDESEDDSDEANDLCNDSLEPTFKREDINRSRLIRRSSMLNNTQNTTYDNTHDTTDVNTDDNMNRTHDTLKDESKRNDDMTETTFEENNRDSTMTGDRTDETYDVSNNESCNDNDQSMDCPATVKKADLKQDNPVSVKGDAPETDNSKVDKHSARETYFVRNSDISLSENADKNDSVLNNDLGDSVDTGISVSLRDNDDLKDCSNISDIPVLKPMKPRFDRVIESQIGKDSSDSLAQFELLETEVNDYEKSETAFKYFDDGTGNKTVSMSPRTKEKKPYFDDIQPSPSQMSILKDLMKKHDVLRSPSIVQDEIPDNYEPTTINKIIRESFSKRNDAPPSLLKNKILLKMHDSIDPFEEVDSPLNKGNILKATEYVRKSIENISLVNNEIKIKSEPVDDVEKEVSNEIEMDVGTPEEVKISDEKALDAPSAPEVSTNAKINADTEIKLLLSTEIKQEPNIEEIGENTEKESDTGVSLNEVSSINDITNSNHTVAQDNNTIDAFENIYKDITMPRATEFDLLIPSLDSANENVSKINTTIEKDHGKQVTINGEAENINNKVSSQEPENVNNKVSSQEPEILNNKVSSQEPENLNNKLSTQESKNINNKLCTQESKNMNNKISTQAPDNVSNILSTQASENINNKLSTQERPDKDNNNHESTNENQTDDITQVKYNLRQCGPRTAKKSLRLRKRNRDEQPIEDDIKLKDIVNLQKEFSDVTMGLPAPEKVVKDMPSPEESGSENQPPLMGAQSCPSKSVTRSRRKLFTPRAEPLDESPGAGAGAGDSGERVRVPRPSYHRATRTRRRLN